MKPERVPAISADESEPLMTPSVGNINARGWKQEAIECLNAKDLIYREMLQIAMCQLNEARQAYAALQAQHEALKDELRRYLHAQALGD